MPLPKSRLAYLDCFEIYEKAEASATGVRVRMADENAAVYFRMRMNNARAIDRRDNEDTYKPGEPLYKASTWDALMVTIKKVDDDYYVYVEPHGVKPEAVEVIPADGEEVVENIVTDKREPAPPVGEAQQIMRR